MVNTKNGKLVAEEKGVSGYQVIDNTPTKIYLYLETSHYLYAKGYWQMEKLIWKVRKAVPSLCIMEARRT